jgi:hypothetical protein
MSTQQLVGLFVEPRYVKQIFYTIINFQKCLSNITLYFFCGKGLKQQIQNLFNSEYKNINQDLLIIEELNCNNLNFETYSNLFKQKEFWLKMNGEYILTIQTDGCLCPNSPYKIEEFYKYDYVGGYAHQKWWWKETNGLHSYNDYQCFNGGFSLRKRQACIDVIEHFPTNESCNYYDGCPIEKYGEDLYFVAGLLKLKYNVGLDLFATKFCTHTDYHYETFCIHNLAIYNNYNSIKKCLDYCIDYKHFLNLENI